MTEYGRATRRMTGFLRSEDEQTAPDNPSLLQLDPDPSVDGESDDPALMRKQIETMQKNIAVLHSHLKAIEDAGIFRLR